MLLRILITGASSGLGAAIARHYAAPGKMLLLWGRDSVRLEAVANQCRTAGATVSIRALDLVDTAAAIAAIADEDTADAIDLAVLSAGIGDIQASIDRVDPPDTIRIMGLVNFVTPSAMAAALADRMAIRGRGHIVVIGSAAAFHALPFAAAYAGSKAGLARFTEALRIGVAPHGVNVLLVSPGPIDTPGGRAVPAPRAVLVQPSYVAARIARASAAGRGHLILPWPFALLRAIDRLLPTALRDRLLNSLRPR